MNKAIYQILLLILLNILNRNKNKNLLQKKIKFWTKKENIKKCKLITLIKTKNWVKNILMTNIIP